MVVIVNYSITDNNLYHNYDYLNDVIKATLHHEHADKAILDIVFVNSDEIQEINREYRNIDRVTDVISFAFEDNDDVISDIRVLGDIYICIPKMKEQAIEYQHSEKRELSFLTVHGILHLLGYDHMKSKHDEEVMFSLQDEILNSLNIVK
jgi:probable rRNA maturation factor